jgi:hypothetical protein
VVALRSLGRRYRGLFAGREDDESPDDLAKRPGPDGRSALDHVVDATRTITLAGGRLRQVLVEDDPVLPPAADDARPRGSSGATGTVDERLSELAWEADALADRAEHVSASGWARTARVEGADAVVTAADLLWDGVDGAIAHLRAAEATLEQVRR